MKELSIEQKARAYDEALERAKEVKDNVEVVEYIFPELCESEDERIRKAIIEFFELQDDNTTYSLVPKKDILAWLEKQGEQKSSDKVEPKFKFGDWIAYYRDDYSREIIQIYDIRDGRYYFTDNVHFSWSVKECDEKSHLWTIQDAKEGDVLVHNSIIFIFMGIENGIVKGICSGLSDTILNFGEPKYDNDYCPATKEQRDALMKAMNEAGYTFDFEKKELKKIEQKPSDEEMKTLLRTEYEKGRAGAIAEFQKAWSEEDECYMSECIGAIATKDGWSFEEKRKTKHWLKSFKDRVQPQPKQEWSALDERNLQGIIDEIQANKNNAPDYDLETYDRFLSWLKSLNPQNKWKPNEEQMRALRNILMVGTSYPLDTLKTLYNDLKKLTEG